LTVYCTSYLTAHAMFAVTGTVGNFFKMGQFIISRAVNLNVVVGIL